MKDRLELKIEVDNTHKSVIQHIIDCHELIMEYREHVKTVEIKSLRRKRAVAALHKKIVQLKGMLKNGL